MSVSMAHKSSVSVSNPSFDDVAVLPGSHSKSSPFNKVSKTMMLGFGCAVAAVAFAGGYFAASAGGSSSATVSDGAGDTDAAIEASLSEIFKDNPDLKDVSASDLSEVIKVYQEDPDGFDDAFIPTDFIRIMANAAEQESMDNSPARLRRLAANTRSLSAYRNLATASALAKASFDKIEKGSYPDPVTTRDDVATVYKEGNRCWIIVQETDSIEDWINNIDLGNDDIMSINKKDLRDERCGCKKKTWWWCSTYNTCPLNTVLGSAFDGFSKSWNEMRGGIYSRIQSKCGGVSEYVFTGYSRGGGILATGAYAIWKEGLIPANKIKLITFGCPRALPYDESNEVHNKFLVERHVLNNDPVPSLPFNWWGYSHYGSHICQSCTSGRNRPYVTNLFGIGDHTNYDSWL